MVNGCFQIDGNSSQHRMWLVSKRCWFDTEPQDSPLWPRSCGVCSIYIYRIFESILLTWLKSGSLRPLYICITSIWQSDHVWFSTCLSDKESLVNQSSTMASRTSYLDGKGGADKAVMPSLFFTIWNVACGVQSSSLRTFDNKVA